MNRADATGIKYFIVHACVEIVCFYLLRYHYPVILSGIIALTFDFFAFLPQGIIGDFITRHKNIPYETIGNVLMLISVFLVWSSLKPVHVTGYIVLAIGNAILHECGAISTVADSKGRLFPSSLFVSGGSFGVVIGQTLGINGLPPYFLIIPLVISEICCLSSRKSLRADSYPVFDCVNKKIPLGIILLAAFIVTTVRSYIGYAIPISWNKEIWQSFFLFFIMGFGKALGGLLADTIGVRKTAWIGTLVAVPFLLFGDKLMVVSCIGVFFFSMTMSITFAMCLSVLKKNPGMAFGITTAALFLGLLPVFFVRFDNMVNAVLITAFSLLSFFLLYFTLKKPIKE
ncbi:MAG: hypothetical protein J5476_10115 [Lachnospiraceae bacterium]|nr:hypothetical protein [Lachnospiraceae bacterium]